MPTPKRLDAYGNVTASSGTTTTALKYRGKYQDAETGYIYLRARYYDPATAQFLTRDPLVHISRSPYGYANQSPLNYTDPSGLIVPVVVAAWAVVEVALAVADAYSTYSTLADGCASEFEKSASVGLLVVGIAGPGGGWSTGKKVAHKVNRPPNLSPEGAGRRGAFRQAKRDMGIPVSQQPELVGPNKNKRQETVQGRNYVFNTPDGKVEIRDDAGGHFFKQGNPQNRGPHFNTPDDGHYDY